MYYRLWDVETGQELLLQEGHYKETHAIAFQVHTGITSQHGMACLPPSIHPSHKLMKFLLLFLYSSSM